MFAEIFSAAQPQAGSRRPLFACMLVGALPAAQTASLVVGWSCSFSGWSSSGSSSSSDEFYLEIEF